MDLNTATINRARVSGRLARRVEVRGVLERWLAGRELSRYGFPGAAIVLVRHMRIRWAPIADVGLGGADDLATVLSGAVRPALASHVPAAAQAVWFADDAELLACLARDVLGGSSSAHWWWRLVLRGDGDHAAVAQRWISGARAVPRAMRKLDRMSLAQAWLDCMDEHSRTALVAGLADQFPIAVAVQQYVLAGTPDVPGRKVAGAVEVNQRRERQSPSRAAIGGAQVLFAPARLPRTRLHQLCLDLAVDPDCARDPCYVERHREPVVAREMHADAEAALALAAATRSPQGPTHDDIAILHASVRTPARASISADTSVFTSMPRRGRVAPAPPRSLARADSQPVVEVEATDAPLTRTVPPLQPAVAQHAILAPDTCGTVTFETVYGGLFFLLNVALHLGLYGDFTRPLQRGLVCSPWRFLLGAGRAIANRGFRRDALSAWLRGRAQVSPAQALDESEPYRIDTEWLHPFHCRSSRWRAVLEAGYLRIVHPLGFLVFEQRAAPEECETLVRAEASRLDVPLAHIAYGVACARIPRRVRPGDRTLARLLPYLRARLVVALGLADSRRLARMLIELPARVAVGEDRIDVNFSLAALPLPVRLAGLDRDPGWIPATGCDVRFHFH